MVFDDVIVAVHLGAHHHDGQIDASTTQLYTFVSKCNSQIIHIMELKNIGNLKVTASIAKGFHHHHKLGGGLDFGAEMVQIANQMVEIDFQNSLMRLLL